jgi:hypothetical protein
MHLYVYYDVSRDAADQARTCVRTLHDELLPRRPRLMRRADEGAAGAETWMEVYEDVDAAFEASLAAAVARIGLDAWTGPRHCERFADLA